MSNEWYNIPKETKINAYTQVAEETGIPPYAVEKDWWVIQTLTLIFEMKIGEFIVFKGGTSLSKAWKLINRFSEDIDLAFDRALLGSKGELTRTGVKNLRKATGKYILNDFYPALEAKFKENGFDDVKLNYIKPASSDADPVKIEVFYPNVIDYPGYIKPRVLLEISCSSLKEPNTAQSLNSFLDDYYFDSSFAGDAISIPTAIPERTFLEKIFLLHEEFQRPREKIRVDRLSRHLYDIFQLINAGYAEKAIENKKLYETIVRHRYVYSRIGGVDYNLHQPQTINPIPTSEFIDDWEADYKTMQEQMIYGESPSFHKIIEVIQDFTKNSINKLEWKMDIEF